MEDLMETQVRTEDTESEAAATPEETPGKPRVGLVRIALGLSIVQITIYLAIFATLNILLPAQIEAAVGEAGKENWLGIITTLAAVVSMVVSPIIGMLSDRTRSPLGRRAPWILVGGAATLVTLNIVGASQVVLGLLLGWCLSQVAVNMVLMPVSSVLPERVPHARRGVISGVTGFATTFAIALAAFVGARFVSTPLLGTAVLSIVALLGAVAYVVIAPDASSKDLKGTTPEVGAPSMWRTMLDGFQNHNFRWVWAGRLCVFLGYSLFSARMLYYVQQQFGSNVTEAAATVARVTAIGGLAMLVGLVVSAPLSDRFGRKPFVYLGGIFIAVGLALVTQITSVPQLIGAWAVVSLAFGSFIGVDQALVADVLPHKEEFAKDLGVINLAATIPQTLAPAIGSVILALTGGAYGILIGLGAVVALSSVFTTWQIRGVK
jgi:MFS family permease